MELGNGDAQITTVGHFHCKSSEDDVQLNLVKCC